MKFVGTDKNNNIIRKNMLIIDNSIGILVELINEKIELEKDTEKNAAKGAAKKVAKEENRKYLYKLFGDDVFKTCQGLSKNELYKTYIGIDRSSITKAYDGTVQGKPSKLAGILYKNKLLDTTQYNEFCDGTISIKVTHAKGRKVLDQKIEKYFQRKTGKNNNVNSDEIPNQVNGNGNVQETKKARTYRNNQKINSEIRTEIKEYIATYMDCTEKNITFNLERGTQSFELKDEKDKYLEDDWLIRFLQWIVKEVKDKKDLNKSFFDYFGKYEFKMIEALSVSELDKVIKITGEITEDAKAMKRIKERKK